MTNTRGSDSTDEKADLLEALGRQRFFLRNTLRGLTDEQARTRSTVSELTLGGLIKHVTLVESRWANFILEGPDAMPPATTEETLAAWMAAFRMVDSDTVDSLLAAYAAVAERTDDLVRSLDDLAASQPLPKAPWHEPGSRWSARRVVMHLIAETAQHAGHADIIRESIDGAKSMG
jgi:uncharacterized damage-inducible protein DinB